MKNVECKMRNAGICSVCPVYRAANDPQAAAPHPPAPFPREGGEERAGLRPAPACAARMEDSRSVRFLSVDPHGYADGLDSHVHTT